MKYLFKKWLKRYGPFSEQFEADLERAFNSGYRAGYKEGWKDRGGRY